MAMNLNTYMAHPERLDATTLPQLRALLAEYPYYQAARLLYVQNLFLLHDPSFGDELRRCALYAPDRSVLFQMVEGRNYTIRPEEPLREAPTPAPQGKGERTEALIDKFLGENPEADAPTPSRRPTAVDATTDYTAILLQMADAEPEPADKPQPPQDERGEELVRTFMDEGGGRIALKDEPEYTPEIADETAEAADLGDDYFTETLARIYIKQGKYEKAVEILRKLNLNFPKRNTYFADQIRFLQKLIINNHYNPASGDKA